MDGVTLYCLGGFLLGCFVMFLAIRDRKRGNMTKEELAQAVQIAVTEFLDVERWKPFNMRLVIDELSEYAMNEDSSYEELSDEAREIVNKVQGEAEAYL